MKHKGYGVVRSIPELEAATSKKILGFLSLDSYSDDKIVRATQKALRVLSGNKKGFLGELNKKVLSNFGLEMPCACIEIEI